METLPSTSKCHVCWNKPEEYFKFNSSPVCFIYDILCFSCFVCLFFTCRSLTSQPSTTQPVQLGVGDAGQDQSTAGATNALTQPAWNPFDDDNFSNLPAEEFKTEDKKTAGNVFART